MKYIKRLWFIAVTIVAMPFAALLVGLDSITNTLKGKDDRNSWNVFK